MVGTSVGPTFSVTAASIKAVIISITNSAGNALITTASAHGLSGGESVEITGNSVAGYNVRHTGVAVVSATTFKTDESYTSTGTGGTWALS